MVNSTHHQAVHQVAPDFRVSAQSADGVIEAIESTTLPILGVQFHPERLATGDDTCFTRLFAFLKGVENELIGSIKGVKGTILLQSSKLSVISYQLSVIS